MLRRIKTDGRTRAILVVVMTSSPVEFDESVRAGSELGMYRLPLNHPAA